ncbi:MAG: proton-conducting transporter membrane subunit, partial [bacterium]
LKELRVHSSQLMAGYLAFVLGINGMVMTRDVFNLFVFMEITLISSYALIALKRNTLSLSAGLKYMFAGGISSSLFLIGTIYLYRIYGTLSIDQIVETSGTGFIASSSVAVFLVLSAILIELKPFPANGWGLDVYQSADPGISAVIAIGIPAGMLFALNKILPMASDGHLLAIITLGMTTFAVSNFLGLRQTDARRLLGYSSAAHIGLVYSAMAAMQYLGERGPMFFYIVGGLFAAHLFAKGGLFWLAGTIGIRRIEDFRNREIKPMFKFMMAAFFFALIGLPPFPGFWDRWYLLTRFASEGYFLWIFLILAGTLFEAVYLFRWLGHVKTTKTEEASSWPMAPRIVPIWLFLGVLVAGGLFIPFNQNWVSEFIFYPLIAGGIIYVLRDLSAKFRSYLVLFTLIAAGIYIWPQLHGLTQIFGAIFLTGGFLGAVTIMGHENRPPGYFAVWAVLLATFPLLLIAGTLVEFLFLWITIITSSYVLLSMDTPSKGGAFKFAVAQFTGFLILSAGFAMAARGYPYEPITNLYYGAKNLTTPLYFIFAGFLVCLGAGGFHVWFRDVFSKSSREISAVFAGITPKGAIFGIILFALIAGGSLFESEVYFLMGWLGAFTGLFWTFTAVFQKNIRAGLGYLSLGLVGNIILAISAMNQAGWVSAMYLSFGHLLIITLLFLATRDDKQGNDFGPGSYGKIAAVIALLALAGIPPLAGYMGNLFLYEALIQKGWFVQSAIVFVSTICAVVFAYRYARGIFNSPMSKLHRPASSHQIIPQIAFAMAIVALPIFHRPIISELMYSVPVHFPQILTASSSDVPSIFFGSKLALKLCLAPLLASLPLCWLIVTGKEPGWAKSLDIILGISRDNDTYAHYAKGRISTIIQTPYIERLWSKASSGANRGAVELSKIYTGNGQTYLIYIVVLVAVLFAISGGFA